MEKRELRGLIENIKKEIGLEENIKLRLISMKYKIASLTLGTNILRLNKKIIEKLDKEELTYVLLHELVHLKVRDVNHGFLFLRELEKYIDMEKAKEIEDRIVKKLI